jgi:hypothetical protein
VLSRNGYVCIHAEAERFIAILYSAIMNPLPQAAGFLVYAESFGVVTGAEATGEKNDHKPAL